MPVLAIGNVGMASPNAPDKASANWPFNQRTSSSDSSVRTPSRMAPALLPPLIGVYAVRPSPALSAISCNMNEEVTQAASGVTTS